MIPRLYKLALDQLAPYLNELQFAAVRDIKDKTLRAKKIDQVMLRAFFSGDPKIFLKTVRHAHHMFNDETLVDAFLNTFKDSIAKIKSKSMREAIPNILNNTGISRSEARAGIKRFPNRSYNFYRDHAEELFPMILLSGLRMPDTHLLYPLYLKWKKQLNLNAAGASPDF